MKEAASVFRHCSSLGYSPYMIVTGGPNAATDRYGPTEARVMKDLAVSEGVPLDSIVCETASLNTIENLIGTKEILENHSTQKVILVTSDFHMKRAKLLFEKICDSRYQLECIEDHPPWASDSEREKEEQTEEYMLSQLDRHLEGYFK